jgi:hypothetical protein
MLGWQPGYRRPAKQSFQGAPRGGAHGEAVQGRSDLPPDQSNPAADRIRPASARPSRGGLGASLCGCPIAPPAGQAALGIGDGGADRQSAGLVARLRARSIALSAGTRLEARGSTGASRGAPAMGDESTRTPRGCAAWSPAQERLPQVERGHARATATWTRASSRSTSRVIQSVGGEPQRSSTARVSPQMYRECSSMASAISP